MFRLLFLTNCLLLSTMAGFYDDPEPGFCTTTTRCKMDSNMRHELDALKDLAFSFPEKCSAYIKYETDETKYEAVPIYPQKSQGVYTPVIANCTALKVLDGDIDLPFYMDVPQNSIEGRTLLVKAIPLKESPYVMGLNFMAYDGDEEIILFHMNPRFNTKIFVRNTFDSGSWQTEETHLDVPFPFEYGVEFTWKIKVDQTGYHVKQDGNQLFTYAHRVPLSKLRFIRITHNVRVTYISFN